MDHTKSGPLGKTRPLITRRSVIKGLGAAAGAVSAAGLMPGAARYVQAQSSAPIRIGFQCHRTGIGAAYGRWYERTTNAAVKLINDGGGIAGRSEEHTSERQSLMSISYAVL